MDAQGNFYGTSALGGTHNEGAVFKISPSGSGWTETNLVNFNISNGQESVAGVILDSAGNVYGTTRLGGGSGYGVVFEVEP